MSSKALLLVEDLDDDVLLFRYAYKQIPNAGALYVVNDGEAALDYVLGHKPFDDRGRFPFPSLVLLDLRIPKIPGLEVLKIIRNTPNLVGLPVVILSSSNQDTDIERAKILGANSYVVKPSHPTHLVEILKGIHEQYLA